MLIPLCSCRCSLLLLLLSCSGGKQHCFVPPANAISGSCTLMVSVMGWVNGMGRVPHNVVLRCLDGKRKSRFACWAFPQSCLKSDSFLIQKHLDLLGSFEYKGWLVWQMYGLRGGEVAAPSAPTCWGPSAPSKLCAL